MMVEMERPFVWPEEPKDFTAYVFLLWVFMFIRMKNAVGMGWDARIEC